jgi:chromosomal replication initiation ATPase DnaA
MGCDYYIDKDLELYDYNNNILSHINLEHEKGYYWFVSILDEDEDGYDEEYTLYIKEKLEPSMKPIVIYSNNSFNKLSFENKYKEIIENELKFLNKTWNHINNIIKVENRYER